MKSRTIWCTLILALLGVSLLAAGSLGAFDGFSYDLKVVLFPSLFAFFGAFIALFIDGAEDYSKFSFGTTFGTALFSIILLLFASAFVLQIVPT